RTPATPISDVRYSYDEWGNIRRIQATYTQTEREGPQASDSWYAYDTAGRMTICNGSMSDGGIHLKRRTPGSVQIEYDDVGRRREATEHLRTNQISPPLHVYLRQWDTMRDERYEYNELGHLRNTEQRIRNVNIVTFRRNGEVDHAPDEEGSWHMLS